MAGKKKFAGRFFFSILIVSSLLFLFFNSNGIIHYLKLSADYQNSKKEIQKVDHQIDQIEEDIDSLRSSDSKIEHAAREKYNMKSPNEEVLEVEER